MTAMKLMKTPRTVEVAITGKCNLRCRYCSFFGSDGDVGQDIPKEDWLVFFEELNRCGVMNVILQGGEPFCRQDLQEIVNGIIRNRMRFSILSNGTLIADETAAFLAATKRCDQVQVSIDGADPSTHDSCRGEGSFSRAIDGIRFLQKYNVHIAVRVTIHRQNVHSLREIAKLLLDGIGLIHFSINTASHFGLCRNNKDMVQLTVTERSLAMETLLQLDKQYNGRIQATAGPLEEARHWLAMEQARQEGKKSLPGRGYLAACGGIFNKIAVRADGMMVPCLLMNHIELGRINEQPLASVWQQHPELKRLRERRKIPLSSFSQCRDCDYINYCTGSCPALAYTISGSDGYPSPDGCFKHFLEEGGVLPDKHRSQ